VDRLSPHLSTPDPVPDSEPKIGIGPGVDPVSPEPKEKKRKDSAANTECASMAGARMVFLPCHLVGFAPRLVAFMVDLVVVNMLAIIFTLGGMIAYMRGGVPRQDLDAYVPLFIISFIIASMTYFIYFHGATGQTVGKMILGLRVVSEDGGPLGYRRAILRWIGYFFSSVFFYFGFLWIIIDRKKQAWHDKLSGSLVVWS